MKVHHLNCATLCARVGGGVKNFAPDKLVCHVLLLETSQGLVLVDAGLSQQDMKDPRQLGPVRLALQFSRDLRESAFNQVKALGFSTKDVTHIVPTHLDLDHAGGAVDFPQAQVHVMDLEREEALNPQSRMSRARYRPQHIQAISHWKTYAAQGGETWMNFQGVQRVAGVKEEIFLIPLPGHTKGHFGVAVQDEKGAWLFHCGDAYYDRREVERPGETPLAVRLFRRVVHENYRQAVMTQKKIAETLEQKSVCVFCAHDHSEWVREKGTK
jgi:glyoxylase-like metal-dependent hydrolase (beta-lactamase superfamily II)